MEVLLRRRYVIMEKVNIGPSGFDSSNGDHLKLRSFKMEIIRSFHSSKWRSFEDFIAQDGDHLEF